ncbi:hypothetical protein [Amycolatopsis dendrobii]|uniref:Uncharacterized protein n=1 Tax=Amycolatopsis dendrobii TaxID=2760662 RepID=A0A7W3ZAB4_9PSEU|nr:hypothetical protein [Amycolatopsis dendrobii]MBB1153508.1 hypothetical protein [Amycolatopsis dendrobii]
MITAKIACTQKLDNGGEGEDRATAVTFTLTEDNENTGVVSAVVTMTVTGEAGDQLAYRPYTLQIVESE